MSLRLHTLDSRNGLSSDQKEELLHGAFRIRYQVYHDEMGIGPYIPKGEIYDEFDFLENTCIFVALDENEPVGTLRLTEYSEDIGLPIFKDFEREIYDGLDFEKMLRDGRRFSEASRFTVLSDYRNGMAMVPALLKCVMYDECIDRGLTDMLIVANPSNVDFYHSAGFREFARKVDKFSEIESPAMYADIDDKFGEIVDRMKAIATKRLNTRGLVIDSGRTQEHAVFQ